MSRVLVSGYYGFGNAGDEAVLAALLASLRRQVPELACEVLSISPEATTRLHGVPATHRSRPRAVLGALRRCDLFISGGGSLLQDVTSLSSLLFYVAQIGLARWLRRRVMIYAQGIGPLRRPAARRLTARVLRGVDWITVRDAESAAELRRIGLTSDHPPIEVTADPVFALAPAAPEWAEAELQRRGDGGTGRRGDGERGRRGDPKLRLLPSPRPAVPPSPRLPVSPSPHPPVPPRLGISVRDWPGLEAWIGPLGAAIRGTAAEIGVQPVYFPLQRAQDRAVCRRLAAQTGGCVLPGDYTPGEWMALAARMDLFLGMRLHALIFAAAAGVPLAGLVYDPKVTALLSRLGEGPALSLAEFDPAAVREALRETWNVREQCSVQIREAARELAAAAEISARRAAALLGRKDALRQPSTRSSGKAQANR